MESNLSVKTLSMLFSLKLKIFLYLFTGTCTLLPFWKKKNDWKFEHVVLEIHRCSQPSFPQFQKVYCSLQLCTFWSLIFKIVHSRRSCQKFNSYTDLSDDEIPMEDIIQQSEDNIQAIKKSPIRSPLKIQKGRYGKRKIRCKKCEGCTSEDCGVCNYCLYVNFGHPLPLFMGRWAPGFLYRTALGLLRTINLFSLYLVC